MKKAKAYSEYPLRACLSLHFCRFCRRDIVMGETYFDGGYGRRSHEGCKPPCQYAKGGGGRTCSHPEGDGHKGDHYFMCH